MKHPRYIGTKKTKVKFGPLTLKVFSFWHSNFESFHSGHLSLLTFKQALPSKFVIQFPLNAKCHPTQHFLI